MTIDPESQRLSDDEKRIRHWKRWGPFLSERQWGTVREDYSPDGSCWGYLSHDHARSRAYRWGEDGLLGFTDRECRLCFAPALWNEKDPILKERLFGLTGPEGNNGEDVKECYYYLRGTPSHSYMKALYKYPHAEFPYTRLFQENEYRKRGDREFELINSGVFNENRYFDLYVEYAKASPDDILIRITAYNRGPEAAPLHLLPSIWFRNTWSWGRTGEGYTTKPRLSLRADGSIRTEHPTLEPFEFHSDPRNGAFNVLFTENETNAERLFGVPSVTRYVKDAFHEHVIGKRREVINAAHEGTKAAFHFSSTVPAGGEVTIRLRLVKSVDRPVELFGAPFDQLFDNRIREMDRFYRERLPENPEDAEISLQAYAGLLWTKQFYYYAVREWVEGDPSQPPPDKGRSGVRNRDWHHLYNRDIISMPDKWEYPWYAAWDLAFHMIPFAKIDPDFAKQQLILFLREWYMHPNGQIPAYEFAFSDVNPPVHAWACWRVYKMTGKPGKRDRAFLERTFHKLLLNFTWWINRKDANGDNLFNGGFLGLDNIGVFDRSAPLPTGGSLEQADATAWMAFYCATMLSISLELASFNGVYGDIASKFFEHFVAITESINRLGGTGLWDELDGFYYDQLQSEGKPIPVRVRSLVGLIPILAVEVLEELVIKQLPGFEKRMRWFLENRPDLAGHLSYRAESPHSLGGLFLLAIPSEKQLRRVLYHLFDEDQFLSPYGIRSMSKVHQDYPYIMRFGNQEYRVDYAPGESSTNMFGGNSNWRGPVWFPINYLIVEALERYHHFYGDEFLVEFPTDSGRRVTLKQAAEELSRRLGSLFQRGPDGRVPAHGDEEPYKDDPFWRELILFYEYFHGDNGRGLGASHQTGWTALVTRYLEGG